MIYNNTGGQIKKRKKPQKEEWMNQRMMKIEMVKLRKNKPGEGEEKNKMRKRVVLGAE